MGFRAACCPSACGAADAATIRARRRQNRLARERNVARMARSLKWAEVSATGFRACRVSSVRERSESARMALGSKLETRRCPGACAFA